MTEKIKLTRAERLKMLEIAKGLGLEISKHPDIDKDTAREMVLMTLEATASELLEKRKQKK